MAIALKDLNAVDDNITLSVDEGHAGGSFALQYPAGGTGTIKVQATQDEITWEDLCFIQSNVTAQTVVKTATAVGLYTGDIPVCKKIRAIKSASVGACICGFGISAPY
jgi:hypothetical protein